MKKKELLTTGQMIDRLKVKWVAVRIFEAVGNCSDSYTHVKKDEIDGELMFYCEQEKKWEYDRLTGSMIDSKWKIKEE